MDSFPSVFYWFGYAKASIPKEILRRNGNFRSNSQEHKSGQKQGVPQKHNGNPAWYPEGKYIIFTAEKEEVPKKFDRWAIPGTGVNCDLWLMTSNGERFYQLTDLPLVLDDEAKGTIHPQFSPNGRKLLWTERVGSGGAWGKWVLRVADFIDEEDNPHLTNIKTYQPGKQSVFYESHAFSKNGQKIAWLFAKNIT